MAWLEVKPDDRLHMLVWKAHWTTPGDPGWRVSWAKNGIPIGFGSPFPSWDEAIDHADHEVRATS